MSDGRRLALPWKCPACGFETTWKPAVPNHEATHGARSAPPEEPIFAFTARELHEYVQSHVRLERARLIIRLAKDV